MRKVFILSLLLVFAFSLNAFAATKARTLNIATNVQSAMAIGDASSGDTAEVDSDGSLQTQEEVKAITTATADGSLVGSACTVFGVVYDGSDVGDSVLIYDADTATGTPKLRLLNGVARSSQNVMIPGGVAFATNVYVDMTTTGGQQVSLIYED
jgi:hypothetical protein